MSASPPDPRVTRPLPPVTPASLVLLVLLLSVACAEIIGHVMVRRSVASDADWDAAVALVRQAHRAGDLVAAAPAWVDPRLRRAAGDLVDHAAAGRSDLAAYDRLWLLTIRGAVHPDEPAAEPELDEAVGPIRVRRWSLGPSPVRYDFVAKVDDAEVTTRVGGRQTQCEYKEHRAGGGGLGKGPAYPAERFACDPKRRWLYVGRTMSEDLDLQPRWCVWHHPQDRHPVTVTFRDVPLADEIVLYGGLYHRHERGGDRLATRLEVRVAGELAGELTHRGGDGWTRLVVPTAGLGAGGRGDVTFEVSAPKAWHRSFCWSATARVRDERGAVAEARGAVP